LKTAGDQNRNLRVIRKQTEEEMSSEQWERAWRLHWQKTSFSPYELPVGDSSATGERDFLMQPRTPRRERARLKRIMGEFEHGFRSLHKLGPAVTVFGSARFKPGHPYYELGRQVGRKLAESGLTVITGGGPGAMEAAKPRRTRGRWALLWPQHHSSS
jgi:SLOG-like protein